MPRHQVPLEHLLSFAAFQTNYLISFDRLINGHRRLADYFAAFQLGERFMEPADQAGKFVARYLVIS